MFRIDTDGPLGLGNKGLMGPGIMVGLRHSWIAGRSFPYMAMDQAPRVTGTMTGALHFDFETASFILLHFQLYIRQQFCRGLIYSLS